MPLLIAFCWLASNLHAQTANTLAKIEHPVQFPFVNDSLNIIQNAQYMQNALRALVVLKEKKQTVVNIMHIGDSHLQAGFKGFIFRDRLIQEFGNAGRGLITPYRIGKSNEPFNYTTKSQYTWKSKRLVFPSNPLPIGISGFTIQSDSPNVYVHIQVKDYPTQENAFNSIQAFHLQTDAEFGLEAIDSIWNTRIASTNNAMEKRFHVSNIQLDHLTNSIYIQPKQTAEGQFQTTVFGFNLKNGKPGVLLHTIAGNGAQLMHYNQAKHFVDQTPFLQPQLCMIALGTNESLAPSFNILEFTAELDLLIQKLKTANPKLEFLLITPALSFVKRGRQNTRLPLIRQALIQYAEDNKIAYYDLQGITGKALNWKNAKLLQNDGIHYTKAGYEYQGHLLAEALLKAYNTYVTNRPR